MADAPQPPRSGDGVPSRRFARERLADVDPISLARSAPPHARADPWTHVRRLLDEAHAQLEPRALAAALPAVRAALAPLLAGGPARWPRPGVPGDPLPAGVAAYVLPIRIALCLGARDAGAGAAARLAALGRRLDAYLDEVAARPPRAAHEEETGGAQSPS